jgi:hypothetical protein
VFEIQPVAGNLRWTVRPPQDEGEAPVDPAVVTLRDVVGALEAYKPATSMTRSALDERIEWPEHASRLILRSELKRVETSPIVLNTAVRQGLLEAMARGVTFADVARACGRTRHPDGSNPETSWLQRRRGLIPEAGGSHATPWAHTDVLALIARQGLNRSPHEFGL